MLADLSSDIFLLILCMTCIEDVLSIERTCSRLRDIIATRHHWLKQLRLLSQACAPDLPPHVDVSTLSGPQLRTLVVNAVASYQNCRKGRIGGPSSRVTTISLKALFKDVIELYGSASGDEKLAPGGRYLLTQFPHKTLTLIDLARDNSIVWSYLKQESIDPEALRCMDIVGYDFQVGRDGSMQVFVLTRASSDIMYYADIIELTPSLNDGSIYESTTRYSAILEYERFFGDFDICIRGDYVAGAYFSSLFVCNWVEQWYIHIDLSTNITKTPTHSLVIQNDHLIYLTGSSKCSLNAIDLRNITNKHGRRVGINEIDRSRLSVVALLPDDIETDYVDAMSLCSFTWTTGGPTELLTVLIHECSEWNEELHFTAIEFIFDPQESSFSKLRRHRSTEPFNCPLRLSSSAAPANEFEHVFVLSSSQCARWVVRLHLPPPSDEGPEVDSLEDEEVLNDSKTSGLVYLGLDEHGELFHSPAPELTTLIQRKNYFETENYSGALVCVPTSKTIKIIYPHA